MDTVRVLRVIEYIGPREAVEKHVLKTLHGERTQLDGLVIRGATLGEFPEIMRTKDSYRLGREDYDQIRNLASDPTQQPATVTEEEFYEMLGVVPPLYREGVQGFLVGEAITCDDRGTVYANYFLTEGGEYRARYHCLPTEAQ